MLHLDFETRSEIDLTVSGSYVYAAHASTRVLCAAYALNDAPVKVWRTYLEPDMPADLHAALNDPELIIASWNSDFERLILANILRRPIAVERFKCVMARARSMALPGKLELCAKALHMPIQKADNAPMLRWMRPLSDGSWASDLESYNALCNYCAIDVETERALSDTVRDLNDDEWQDFHITCHINDRGIPVDIDLAAAAQHYARDEFEEICARLEIVTAGKITGPKQFERIKNWLQERLPEELKLDEELVPDKKNPGATKIKIGTFDGPTREELLHPDNEDLITADLREFIQLIHDGGRASTAKFAAITARSGLDARLRGAYVFNGAGQTHRFSAVGFQPHNLTRAKLERIEDVVEAILRQVPKKDLIDVASYRPDGSFVFEDKEPIKKAYNVLTILSRTLRPSIISGPGRTLVWSDFEQVEARVLPWLSAEPSAETILEVFRSGVDVYRYQALSTFNVPTMEAVTKDQRQACKVQILSLGFGGGVGAFHAMGRNYGLHVSDEQADMYKMTWRRSNPWAMQFWNALEVAAFSAVRYPETEFSAGRVVYFCAQGVLWCMLPNGSMLAYPFPEIRTVESRFGPQDVVTAIKGSFHPKKGTNYWPRMKLWGGFQAENVTQGFAAQLLRRAIREMHQLQWGEALIGHTHDELLAEVFDDEVEECGRTMKTIMSTGPACAAGLPLAAEWGHGFAYGK